jgi:hypothetical protein
LGERSGDGGIRPASIASSSSKTRQAETLQKLKGRLGQVVQGRHAQLAAFVAAIAQKPRSIFCLDFAHHSLHQVFGGQGRRDFLDCPGVGGRLDCPGVGGR